jgi:hypothetical protein
MTKPLFTAELARALGMRDRVEGVDSEMRNLTLARFHGRKKLEQAYWAGWNEANDYFDACWQWGREECFAEMAGHLAADIEEAAMHRAAGRLN